MKALVTGATGFIGGALAQALAREGWQVRLLVRPARLKFIPEGDHWEVVPGDLAAGQEVFERAVQGCEVVFHSAAIRDRWGTPLHDYARVNVHGTRRLLEACLGRVKRFVQVSSVGVYGYPEVEGIDESFPLYPNSGKAAYHSSKAEADSLVHAFSDRLETVIVQPTITYGPGDANGMMTRLIEMMAKGRFVRVGHGNNSIHLVYIDDLTRGLILTGVHPQAPGQTFIMAGPRPVSFKELVSRVYAHLGKSGSWRERVYIPEGAARPIAFGFECLYRAAKLVSPGFQGIPWITPDRIDTICRHSAFSWKKALERMGWSPEVDLDEGIEKTMTWMSDTGRLRLFSGHSLTSQRSKKVA